MSVVEALPRRPTSQINTAGLRHALRRGEIVPYFQPIILLRSGQLAGFEVLARWIHPELGTISPEIFIPLAERAGLINALMQQLLEGAFRSSIPDPLTLSVNISTTQLRSPGLSEMIRLAAQPSGFPLRRLVVEITESALIENLNCAVGIAEDLKRMGCKISLDDFGTGYSSLLHLQSLPFNELKVDRSFVSSMTERRESRKIVAAVVGLGQSLGLGTVAEGIETKEQAEMMLWLGCELGQGWLFGKAVPARELADVFSITRQKLSIAASSSQERMSVGNLDTIPSQRLAQLQAVYDGAPVGLGFIDQSMRYVNLNRRLADMNGARVEDHLGSKVSDMVPELFPHIEPLIRRALQGESISEVEVQIPSSKKIRLVSYEPARDEAGEVAGISLAVLDITHRKRAEEALRESEAHYRNMVELNPRVLWIMDRGGRNLDVTPRWDKSTGRMTEPDRDGGWLDSIHPDDLKSTMQSIAASRRSESAIDVEYRAATEDGGWRRVRSRGAPRFDSTGQIVCWYGSIEDVDQQSEQEKDEVEGGEALTFESEGRSLQLPVSSIPFSGGDGGLSEAVGSFEEQESEDEEQRRVEALEEFDLLDTLPEAEYDDLAELASQICSTPIGLISLVDSHRTWFKAAVGLDACETAIEISFCAHAIRQRGLFVVEDASKDARFEHNPLVVGDPNVRFYAAIPLYAKEGIAVGALCVVDYVPRILTPEQAKALTILGHQVQARMELRLERKKLLRAMASSQALAANLKTNNQALWRLNLELERIATTDALTGLLNRHAFEERIQVEMAVARRKDRPLCLLLMDIDDFKRRKDQLGHALADDALRHAGEILRKVLRVGDYAARLGGEEFAVILPETTLAQATFLAKRIQRFLGSGAVGFPRITVSLGIACLSSATTNWETLVSQAELAMYATGRGGEEEAVPCGDISESPLFAS